MIQSLLFAINNLILQHVLSLIITGSPHYSLYTILGGIRNYQSFVKMPKKRRKLSKDHERSISLAQKEIELILAKIHDIYDDDIRGEYAISFAPIKFTLDQLISDYKDYGITDKSKEDYSKYLTLLSTFKSEYEI